MVEEQKVGIFEYHNTEYWNNSNGTTELQNVSIL